MKLLITGLAGLCSTFSLVAQKPNIVYIFTDQQTASAMSCARNNDLRTPNMDKLAAKGVRFINAYCAAPLCTPSRSAMFTGVTPWESDQFVNGSSIPTELQF